MLSLVLKGESHAQIPCPLSSGLSPADGRPGSRGRSPEALSKEFEPTAQAIRNWVKQDDLDNGRREDGLTNAN